MRRGARLVAGLATIAVVPAVIVLPVVTMPAPQVAPITPVVTSLDLVGIDPAGLRASEAPADPVRRAADAAVAPAGPAAVTPTTPAARTSTAARPPAASRPTAPARATAPASSTALALAPAVVTPQTSTAPFTLVGVDWLGTAPTGTTVQVRVRESGTWSPWSELDIQAGHGPDDATVEGDGTAVRSGTEPLLTAEGSDGVQVRIDTPGGVVPRDAKVTLVDPQQSASDAAATPTPVSSAVAAGDPLRPAIITRAQWGADERMRSRGPIYTGPIQAAFLHHTASSTNYTPAQSTAQVRALYAWYTKGLKYSDIAYNFLVDRYGRLYEGRAGGVDKNVLGGHTAGFNQNTFAVSAIGNFDTYKPTSAELGAITTSVARLMAWKLALNHRDPLGTTTLRSDSSAGTSRYAVGAKAVVPTISGHRDIGSTACPGRYLEPILPKVRALARAYMGAQILTPAAAPSVAPYGAKGTVLTVQTTAPLSWRLEVVSVCQTKAVRVLSGTQKRAGRLQVAWDQKGVDGKPVAPGTYKLVLSGRSGAKVAYPTSTSYVVSATPTSPPSACPTPTATPTAKPSASPSPTTKATPTPTATPKPTTTVKPTPTPTPTPVKVPVSFSFAGSGFGHGVGLSQYGARGMALEGASADAILGHYYTATTRTAVRDDQELRVNLLHLTKSVVLRGEPLAAGGGRVEVTVTGLKPVVGTAADVFTVVPAAGGTATVTRTTAGRTTAVGTGAGVVVRWAGTRAPGTAGTAATLLNVSTSVAGLATSGHRYRYGFVDIATTSAAPTALEVVNQVRLHDEYLLGIGEMPSSWPAAALQSQVSASRSYALAKYGSGRVKSACRCHLDDGGGPYFDQTFVGWSKETDSAAQAWRAAVAATQKSPTTGVAVLSGGKPITAFYFSSSGGRTQNSQDVWVSALPYATSVDDHWSLAAGVPNRVWTPRVKTQAAVAKAFGLPDVVRLDVSDRFPSGGVRTAKAWSSTGATATLKGELLRSRLGLPSTWVTKVTTTT